MRKMIRAAIVCMTVWLVMGTQAQAQNWTATKLNDSAKINETGAIIVLGTEGSYNDNTNATRNAVFDGATGTFFDPSSNAVREVACWAGFELQAPMMVTRIRYLGRSGTSASRMRGCLFQGADDETFADPVTIHTAAPPANWPGTNWVDVVLSTTNTFRAFRYLRIIGPNLYTGGASPQDDGTCCGNAAEVEFYGAPLSITEPPPAPALSFSDVVNWRANFRWTVSDQILSYEIQRMLTNETEFVTVLEEAFRPPNEVRFWIDPLPLCGNAAYRIRSRNNIGDSPWTDIPILPRNAASGAWIGIPGSYSDTNGNRNMTGDKIFDGDTSTFFDGPNASNGNGLWSGLDLGAPRTVTHVRYVPRRDSAGRMANATFEAANNPDFTGATLLHQVSGTPPIDWPTEVQLDSPVTARYFRFLSPNNGWGNAAEVEFVATACAPRAPTGLAVASSDLTNDFPVLSWTLGAKCLVSSSVVHRATAPGGPYVPVTPQGVTGTGWTDTTPLSGVTYYYKVSSFYDDGTTIHQGPLSDAYVSHRRCERLERTWEDNTQLKEGITTFFFGTLYQAGREVEKVFDGNVSTTADYTPAGCTIGLDMGIPYAVSKIRFAARAEYPNRTNGSTLYGSNDLASISTTLLTFAGGAANTYTWMNTVNTDAHRYIFITRPSGDFYGNIAELELYGWPGSNVVNILTAPSGITAAFTASTVQLGWAAGNGATSYIVQKTLADAPEAWETIGTPATPAWTDTSPAWGVLCLYRIASVRPGGQGDDEQAWSDSVPVIAYAPGTGDGLTAYYSTDYTRAYDPNEALRLTRKDSVIDFTWTGGPIIPDVAESVTNVLVTWNGTLTVPHAGDYIFHFSTDDGCALRIGDTFVINDWTTGSRTRTGTITLTAGDHPIRADVFQASGGAVARLEWDGAVTRAVIPSAQLTPAPLTDGIAPWSGRTFNSPKLGAHAPDPATGGIKISNGGQDLHAANEGHHFVWQPVSGPFLLEAKVQQFSSGDASSKAMLMLRNTLETGSPLLAGGCAATTPGGYGGKLRTVPNAAIDDIFATPAWHSGATNPFWLRLKRVRQTIILSIRNEGGDWETFYTYEDTGNVFNDALFAGMVVSSQAAGTGGVLPSAVFSDIRLIPLSGTVLLVQ